MHIGLVRFPLQQPESIANVLARPRHAANIIRQQFLHGLAQQIGRRTQSVHSRHRLIALSPVRMLQDMLKQFLFWKIDGDGDIEILAENALRALGHEHPVVFFAAPQRFVRPFSLGDVNQQAARQPSARLRITNDHRLVPNPNLPPVLRPHPVFHPERTPFLPTILQQCDWIILRVEVIPPEVGVRQTILRTVAQNRIHLRAEIEKAALRPSLRRIRNRRNLLHQLPIFGLGFLKRSRRPFSFLPRAQGRDAIRQIVRHLGQQFLFRAFKGSRLLRINRQHAER